MFGKRKTVKSSSYKRPVTMKSTGKGVLYFETTMDGPIPSAKPGVYIASQREIRGEE